MRPFHRRNADDLRHRVGEAVLEAETMSWEADLWSVYADKTYRAAS